MTRTDAALTGAQFDNAISILDNIRDKFQAFESGFISLGDAGRYAAEEFDRLRWVVHDQGSTAPIREA